ncbi:Ribbon-helix-helix protein CopG domain-containing protein [Entamoeba marina]
MNNKEKQPKPNKTDTKIEQEKRVWKTKYDDSTIRIRLEKNLYNKLTSIKETHSGQKMSLNKIINKLYDNFIQKNPQFAVPNDFFLNIEGGITDKKSDVNVDDLDDKKD